MLVLEWIGCLTKPCSITPLLSDLWLSLTTHTHTHTLNGPLSVTTQVSRYQKGETNLDYTEARDSEWQWHQLGRMQVCTSLQTDSHASTSPLSFLQVGCPSCCPTNCVKALKLSLTTMLNYRMVKVECLVQLDLSLFALLLLLSLTFALTLL